VEANDNPININHIISFFNSANAIDDYKNKMRNFAIDNLSWEAKMKKVVEFVELHSAN